MILMTSHSEPRRGISALLLIPLLLLIVPATGSAEVEFENAVELSGSRYAHCNAHNEKYYESESLRCGDASSGVGVVLAQVDKYGPFLCGVCQSCLDRGTCSLTDTMIVVGNVGNFILGIVGSLALLTFVIGGVLILVSQGEKGKIDRGRKFILAAAVGIAVTLGSVLILRTLLNVLETGSPGTGSSAGIVCDDTNDGASCGDSRVCEGGVCVELLDIEPLLAL